MVMWNAGETLPQSCSLTPLSKISTSAITNTHAYPKITILGTKIWNLAWFLGPQKRMYPPIHKNCSGHQFLLQKSWYSKLHTHSYMCQLRKFKRPLLMVFFREHFETFLSGQWQPCGRCIISRFKTALLLTQTLGALASLFLHSVWLLVSRM